MRRVPYAMPRGPCIIPRMPRLSDETVSALAHDLAGVLHAHVPGWTSGDPHDPGLTILEVMAFLADTLAYRERSDAERRRAADVIARLGALAAGCAGDAMERVHYFEGRLLTASDLNDDQRYHRKKLARALLALHGDGIVKGLDVTIDGDGGGVEISVSISAGAAITPAGELLVIEQPCRRCRLQVGGDAGFVVLTYTERETGSTLVAPLPDGTAEVQAARIAEDVGVSFGAAVPAEGVAIAQLIRSTSGWQVDQSFVRVSS